MSRYETEKVNCNLCGSDEKEIISVQDESRLVRCRKCNLVYVDNRLTKDETMRLYGKDYFTQERRELSRIREKHILKTIRKLKNRKEKGRLLDIGCAEGEFLKLVEENTNLEPFGVDISEYAAEQAKSKGLNVKCCESVEASFEDEYFDVITMRHVLEHVHDPLQTIKEMNRILKKDGILIIEVPNSKYMLFKARLVSRVLKRPAYFLEIKEHLYHFDDNMLNRLLSLGGFKKKTFFHGFADKSSRSRVLTVGRILYSYLSSIIFFITRRLNIGTVLNVYASKGLKICFNIGRVHNIRAGVNRYAVSLAEALKRQDNDYAYHHYRFDMPAVGFKKFPIEIVMKVWRLFKVLYKEQMSLAIISRQQKIDLVHSPAYVMPVLSKCLSVITIHDMAYLVYPEKFTNWYRAYLKFWVPISARKANLVIADSQNTKNDIIKYLHMPENKIEIIYPGVGDEFKNADDTELLKDVLKKYGLIGGKYVLYVGTMEPRKNVVTLLKAYRCFLDSYQMKCCLVIAGEKGWLYEEIFEILERLTLRPNVIFTGRVLDEELPYLYKGAGLFVYPSLYEGFGLPPLEAMASGTPVVTSNTSSLPEVAGDAALMVSPIDVDGLAGAMFRVLSDENLRKELIEKGLERASKFSWEETAARTVQAYNEVLGV